MNKRGRPKERGNTYRFSLYLDGDLKEYIKHVSWKNHQTITQYLNEKIRAEMDLFVMNGGTMPKKKKKITVNEIESILGYEIEIVESRKDKSHE